MPVKYAEHVFQGLPNDKNWNHAQAWNKHT